MPVPIPPVPPDVATKGALEALKIVADAAPGAIGFVRSVIKGKKVMIVGPKESGKSTFVQFLRDGTFQIELEPKSTRKPHKSSRFQLTIGESGRLKLFVKNVIELPGQEVNPASFVASQRPHALIIILDMGAALSQSRSVDWLRSFFGGLDEESRRKNRRRNRLRSVTVVLNKMDRVTDKAGLDRSIATLREITKTKFDAANPKGVQVRFMKCIMVQDHLRNPGGRSMLNSIVNELATSLEGD